MAPQIVTAEKRYRISLLLDTYGELLTDKQREFLRSYYEDDLSFGEIARDLNISRQAIFDSVKHGEAALENYERVLGLIRARQKQNAAEQTAAGNGLPVRRWADAGARLRGISAELARFGQGNGAQSEIKRIAEELDGLAEEMESMGGPIEAGGFADRRMARSAAPKTEKRPTAKSSPPAAEFETSFASSIFRRGRDLEVD